MYGLRDKPSAELVVKGIAPIQKDRWTEGPPQIKLPVLESTRQERSEQAPQKFSKRELKKAKKASTRICLNHALGRCTFGGSCKYGHGVEAFVASCRPHLLGLCPFSQQKTCPFGVLCRWAPSHAAPDEMTTAVLKHMRRSLTDPAEQAGLAASTGQPGRGSAEVQSIGADRCSESGKSTPMISRGRPDEPNDTSAMAKDSCFALQEDSSTAAHNGCAEWMLPARDSKVERPQGGFSELGTGCSDGSVPLGPVELPVLPAELPVVNSLDKGVQKMLWRNAYDFTVADRLVEQLGGTVTHRKQPRGQRPPAAVIPDDAESGSTQAAQAKRNADIGVTSLTAAETTGTADAAATAAAATPPPEHSPSPKRQRIELDHGQSGTPPKASGGTDGRASAVDPRPENGSVPIFDVQRSGEHWADMHTDTPLKPQEKRKLDLRGKLYLAPLTTVGNLPYRRVCKSLGADVTCGEMALATNLLQGQASEWALLKRHASEDLFGVQICGAYPDSMVRCAHLLEDNITVDFVDINMGCPIDLICSKGAGSALLQKPARMEQIVRGMSARLSCPLTVKVRRGYNNGQDVAHALLPQVAAWGAAAATLHGRSREQRYTKLADWEYIARCARAADPLPIVGNGDIFSFTEYEEHLAACPQLATTMLARGALIKPWLFTEIKERRHWDISAGERFDLLKQFCSAGLLHWGSDDKGVENTRRFLLEWMSFLCRYVPVGLLEVVPQRLNWRPPFYYGRSDLETLLASQNPADWVGISEMLLGPPPPGFRFEPKHKSNAYAASEQAMALTSGSDALENG